MIVNFHTLHTANLGDFVTVHDRDSSGTVIALLDGTYENESVVSCSKSLFVRYISRYQLDFSDFVASFKSIGKMYMTMSSLLVNLIINQCRDL